MPVLLVPVPSAVLGSSQAPVAGMSVVALDCTYSAAWHRWEPAKAVLQAAWAD